MSNLFKENIAKEISDKYPIIEKFIDLLIEIYQQEDIPPFLKKVLINGIFSDAMKNCRWIIQGDFSEISNEFMKEKENE